MPELDITCLNTVASRPSGIDAVRCFFPEPQISVRQLIEMAVREQCRQLEQRYRTDLEAAEMQLARQYLSAAQVAEQVVNGRVTLAGAHVAGVTGLDVEREIARAWLGFQSQAFMILVGAQRCTTLDEPVRLAATQPVQFIRMIPLVGG